MLLIRRRTVLPEPSAASPSATSPQFAGSIHYDAMAPDTAWRQATRPDISRLRSLRGLPAWRLSDQTPRRRDPSVQEA